MPRTPEETRVQVRPAAVEDGERLTEIDNLTWSTDVTPTPRWDPGKAFFPDAADVRNVLVAHAGEDVVGYLRMRPSPFGPMSAHVQHIDGLAVHPAHQGRRVGRALVEAAEREARRRG
ncbi:GNAT family N-acetyltransferase, partial [Streptomyces sp. SID3343]|uniref:GNAT family N-acetyltransferase n=1 Tax=Streptomyces sp. SID3343 TaxID=2690260 RepID=UPI00136F4CBE